MGLTKLFLFPQDVCKIVVNYCQILKRRVRLLSENSDHGGAINMVGAKQAGKKARRETKRNVIDHDSMQLCVVVNDLEYLRSVISRLPTELKWAVLRDQTQNVIGESQFNNTLPLQLVQAQSFLCREIRSALDTLGKKVRHQRAPLWQAGNHCNSEGRSFIISPHTLSFQLNTDVESHVRSMSTRQRLPSKSTEEVRERDCSFIQTRQRDDLTLFGFRPWPP